jgi:hypothetical protein
MKPGQRLQEDHAKPDPLQRVQHTEPEPQTPAQQRADDGVTPREPGDVQRDAGCGPGHLAPAGRAEGDGEDGDEPGVVFGVDAEGVEGEGPDEDEEEEEQEDDGPGGGVLRGPEEPPVAVVGCGEEEVLKDYHYEEPLRGNELVGWIVEWGRSEGMTYHNDFTAEEGVVEGWDVARGFAVVVWKAEVENNADGPH